LQSLVLTNNIENKILTKIPNLQYHWFRYDREQKCKHREKL